MSTDLKKAVCLLTLILSLAHPAASQGGSYSGPEGHGGVPDFVPSTPNPGPAPTAGSTPVVAGEAPTQASPPTSGAGLTTASTPPLDLSHWTYWWYFNRDRLLNLRTRSNRIRWIQGAPIQAPAALSGEVIGTRVLPVLIKLAATDQAPQTRASALIALARGWQTGGPSLDAALAQGWSDEEDVVRECATLALGITGAVSAAPRLSRRLLEGPGLELTPTQRDRTRAFAAYGLAMLCHDSLRPEISSWAALILNKVLADDSESVDLRAACALALGHLNLPWKQGPSPSKTGSQNGLIEHLLQLESETKSPVVRAHILSSLARLSRPELPGPLLAALIERLDQCTRPGQDPLVAQAATTAVGLLGSHIGKNRTGALFALLERLSKQKGQAPVRQLAWIALAELESGAPSKEVLQILEGELDQAGPQDLPWACLAAGLVGYHCQERGQPFPRALAEKLRAHLGDDGSPDTRDAAVLALGLANDRAAAEGLARILKYSASKQARALAALSLGLIGHQPAAGPIAKLIPTLSTDQLSLDNAAMGLSLLDRPLAARVLTRALEEAASPNSASFLAAAMGRAGDRSSLEALGEVIASPRVSSWSRTFAAVAMGILAERSLLPWRAALAWHSPYRARTDSLYDTYGRGVLNLL